ncbi:MAG: hypothetical protein OXE93_08975 [bacterium]|nr:hypothetical protein [bacterium]
MPIHKSTDWGASGPLGPNGKLVHSDSEAHMAIQQARRAKQALPELGLLGGDLCRTLGGRGDSKTLRTNAAQRCEIDLGAVLLDGRLFWFCAHLIAKNPLWGGEVLVAMNAAWLGNWNLGPKAHPGDGLLDVSHGQLSLSNRLKARKRALTGDHLPHPAISYKRLSALQVQLSQPTPVWVDGVAAGKCVNVSLRVEPAALTVVV